MMFLQQRKFSCVHDAFSKCFN